MGEWLVAWDSPGAHPAALVCIPQAGAGCGQYRPWRASLGPAAAVLGLQLPGREERWAEPPAGQFSEVIAGAAAELARLVPAGTAIVIYGHSFGGLIGFELCRALGTRYSRWPAALVVAACRPPACWAGAGRDLLDDDAGLLALLAARGLDPALLDEDSLAEMLEPLRHDARLSLSYQPHGDLMVPCLLEVWGGQGDEMVTPAQLGGWRRHAGGPFRRRDFPGGHAFHAAHPQQVLTALGTLVRAAARSPGVAG
jgi:surfactin synthase thioesterase subunit